MKEKEIGILKIVKPRSSNVAVDSDVQGLIFKYNEEYYREEEHIFNDFIRKNEKISSAMTTHNSEFQVPESLSSFAMCINWFLNSNENQAEFFVTLEFIYMAIG